MVKTDIYSIRQADYPLLISIPHNGSQIPDVISQTMTEVGKSSRDTDWLLDRLYDFPETRDAGLIASNFSWYVTDLNRDANACLLYTSPSPRDLSTSRMPSSA